MKTSEIETAIKYYNLQIKTAKYALEQLYVLREEAQALENGQIQMELESLK